MTSPKENYLTKLIELKDEVSVIAYIKKINYERHPDKLSILSDGLEQSLSNQLNFRGYYDFFDMTNLICNFNPPISEKSYKLLSSFTDVRRSTNTKPQSGESEFYRTIKAVAKSDNFNPNVFIEHNERNIAITIIAVACLIKDVDAIDFLYERGANIDDLCTPNYTPIQFLSRGIKTNDISNEITCLIKLLEHGADPHKKCKVDNLSTYEHYQKHGVTLGIDAIQRTTAHIKAVNSLQDTNLLNSRSIQGI